MRENLLKKGNYIYLLAYLCYGLANSLSLFAFKDGIPTVVAGYIAIMCQGSALVLLAADWFILFSDSRAFSLASLILISLTAYLSVVADNFVLFWLASFMLLSPAVEWNKLFRCTFILSVITIVFAFTGVLSEVLISKTMVRSDGFVRYACGFNHPNQAGCVVLTACFSWSYLRMKKWGAFDRFLMLAAFVFVGALLDSRTTMLLLAFLFFTTEAVHAFSRKARFRKVVPFAVLVSVALVVLASFYMMMFYDGNSPVFKLLNEALSGRPYYLHYYWQNYPPKLLAQDLTNVKTVHDWGVGFWVTRGLLLDNAYGQLLFSYGWVQLVLFLIVLVGFPLSIIWSHRDFDIGIALMIPMVVYGLMESQMLIVTFSVFPIVFFSSLFNSLRQKRRGLSG